eukprot:Sspe_Gene.80700::Locus_51069_Transcript_1_1_Confidence_1.000_Length_1076::g.80700::m.80700
MRAIPVALLLLLAREAWGIGYHIKFIGYELAGAYDHNNVDEYVVKGSIGVGVNVKDLTCSFCATPRGTTCVKQVQLAQLSGSEDGVTTYSINVTAWEYDIGSCNYIPGDNDDYCVTECVSDIRDGEPGVWNDFQCHCDLYPYTFNLSKLWYPVSCKGGLPSSLSSDAYTSDCAEVSPGGTCTVSCVSGYHPASSIFSCPSDNIYESSSVQGVAPECRTVTPTPSFTLTPTRTLTSTGTATVSSTRTLTGSPTRTSTLSVTSTLTPTATGTATRTHTNSLTSTASRSVTRTRTATLTVSATLTRTSTSTPTSTASRSVTCTRTATLTVTSTDTLTRTPSLT